MVNIAPYKVDGTLLGEWIPAEAREVREDNTSRKVDRLLDHKYGLLKKKHALASAIQGRKKYTVLELKMGEEK